jgi:3-hydroxyacyl-CoA dehydrogenase
VAWRRRRGRARWNSRKYAPTAHPPSPTLPLPTPPTSLSSAQVGVIGMGIMGHGIAQTAAESGLQVVSVDQNAAAVEKGLKAMRESLVKIGSKKGNGEAYAAEVLSRHTSSTSLSAVRDCDVVIEAVVENLEVKKALFRALGQECGAGTVLASNTSSLPITAMAEASGRPRRFLGLHFFSPVQVMGLVEVVRTSQTDGAVVEAGRALAKKMGKTAVTCKDTPGFIVNRLLVPYLAQAIALLERGDAGVEDIDSGMKLGAGHPMGPLMLADYVGLDTCLFILQGWVRDHPAEKAFFVPKLLEAMVKDGRLGRKSGAGFYKWQGAKAVAVA